MDWLIFITEFVGTVAFAASGAMTGIRKQMDLFGVIILGVTTAVGGGVIRDIVLGSFPPAMFRDPKYALCAIAVSAILFLPRVHRTLARHRRGYHLALLISDSIGLGVFVVSGVRISLACAGKNLFLAVFVGTITGVGGGVIRDILAGDMPFILVRQVYACAAIAGAIACYLLWPLLGAWPAMLIGLALVIALRLAAAHYRWNLPRAEISSES